MDDMEGTNEEALRKLREFHEHLKDPANVQALIDDGKPSLEREFAGDGATPPVAQNATAQSPVGNSATMAPPPGRTNENKSSSFASTPYQAKDDELEFLQDRAGKRRQAALYGQAGDTIASAFQSKGAQGSGTDFWKNFAAEGDRKIGDLKMRRSAEDDMAKKDPNSPVSKVSRDWLSEQYPDLTEKLKGMSAADIDNIPGFKQILEMNGAQIRAKIAADAAVRGKEATVGAKATELETKADGLRSSLPQLYGPQLKTLKINPDNVGGMNLTQLETTLRAVEKQKSDEAALERTEKSGQAAGDRALTAAERAEQIRIKAEQRKADADDVKEKGKSEAKANTQTQEIRGFYTTMKKDLTELRSLVNQKGTFEAMGSHNKQLEQRLDDIAVTMAKFVDPNSVARESEVAGFRKQLFSPSLSIKNKTAQEVMDSFERIIEDRLKTAYEVRGIQPPDMNNPNAGAGPKQEPGFEYATTKNGVKVRRPIGGDDKSWDRVQ